MFEFRDTNYGKPMIQLIAEISLLGGIGYTIGYWTWALVRWLLM